MSAHLRSRLVYVLLAVLTIALGLWVHRGAPTLGADARDIIGDALWAAMIAWSVGAVVPSPALVARSAVAFGICVAVELSQLIHAPGIDALRQTTLGHLILGSGFDPRDLLAYAAGVSVAALLERLIRRRARSAR